MGWDNARRGAAALSCLVGLWLAWRIVPYQVDDAFITYRFAANVLSGSGLVFNVGGETVEGFSSPAWLAATVVSGAALGTESIPYASTALGLCCFLTLLALLIRYAGTASVIAVSCLPTLVFYAVTGLETVLFAGCVAAFGLGMSGRAPRSVLFASAALACWVRPEGPFLAISGLAQALSSESTERRETLALWFRAALILGVSFVALVALRFVVFGEILPNTYYAKPADRMAGAHYVLNALGEPWALSLLVAALLVGLSTSAAARGYLLSAICFCGAAIFEGGDWMPQARMMLPAFTMLALALGERAAQERSTSATRMSEIVDKARLPIALLVAALAALTAHAQGDTSQRSLGSIRREARVLRERVERSGAASIAAIDIGELGFLSPLMILDLAGLTDSVIAHADGSHMNKLVDLDYVFARHKPDLIMVRFREVEVRPETGSVRLPPSKAMSLIEARVVLDPRIRTEYTLSLVQYPRSPRDKTYARALFRRKTFVPSAESRLGGPIVLMPTRAL